MSFTRGMIVGAVLAVLAAYVHDTMEPGSTNPLVNWPRATELEKTAYNYVADTYDRISKWLKSRG